VSTRRSPPPVRLRSRLTAFACAFALLAPSALAPSWAQVAAPAGPPPNQLPTLGDPAGQDFGIGTERKLGDEIMREIRADPDYLDDPVLLEYLQTTIWQPLLASSRARGNISPTSMRVSRGSRSSCATRASMRSRCRAATSA